MQKVTFLSPVRKQYTKELLVLVLLLREMFVLQFECDQKYNNSLMA